MSAFLPLLACEALCGVWCVMSPVSGADTDHGELRCGSGARSEIYNCTDSFLLLTENHSS